MRQRVFVQMMLAMSLLNTTLGSIAASPDLATTDNWLNSRLSQMTDTNGYLFPITVKNCHFFRDTSSVYSANAHARGYRETQKFDFVDVIDVGVISLGSDYTIPWAVLISTKAGKVDSLSGFLHHNESQLKLFVRSQEEGDRIVAALKNEARLCGASLPEKEPF